MALVLDDYKQIAFNIKNGITPTIPNVETYMLHYFGDVVPKERPRKSKSGGMYTPATTRNFEKSVKEWAINEGMQKVNYPIRVRLSIYDRTADTELIELSRNGIAFAELRDLDNMAKAVLDGLNGVMYKDDRQIVELTVRRSYGSRAGFSITYGRAGLSKLELTQLRKHL